MTKCFKHIIEDFTKIKMVLGLIDFLLGGKKKTKVPRNAQVSGPSGTVGGSVSQSADNGGGTNSVPDGTTNPTQNAGGSNLEFQDSSSDAKPEVSAQHDDSNVSSGKKSISDVINRIHKELKSTNESVVNLVTEVKEVQNSVNSIDHRVSELEGGNKQFTEKMSEIDENMGKFLSLYELVNNQYNPFVDNETVAVKPKEIVLSADGSSIGGSVDDLGQDEIKSKLTNLDSDLSNSTTSNPAYENDLDASLLELDTLDIEAAAADAVPLTHLKSNTNSLVVILSWLEYMVKKAGVEDTKGNLRYYTETLRWITPEVYFELDKFLKGMTDLESSEKKSLNVRDHIVSLYFISKLNEKVLDQKLTKAVLQIIKEQ